MTNDTIIIPGEMPNIDEFDVEFDQYEQAERPITQDSRLYWFNGLPTDTDFSAIGWHLKAGINPPMDEVLNSILEDKDETLRKAMGLLHYKVQHKQPDKNGNNDPVAYWRLKTCSLIVIAHRNQSTLEMRRKRERLGVAWNWEIVREDNGKIKQKENGKDATQTVLKARVFIHELYRFGVTDWFPLTLSGYMTDEFLIAMDENHRALEAYSAYRRAQGKNPVAPFYLLSIPMTAGPVKNAGDSQSTIYPTVAQIPATINKAYLNEHFIGFDLVKHIREELLDQTTIWSYEESLKIAEGTSSDSVLQLTEGSGESQSESAEVASAVADDRVVTAEEVAWIRTQYCGNEEGKIQQICAYYKVAEAAQLRLSQYQALYTLATQATQGQKRTKK